MHGRHPSTCHRASFNYPAQAFVPRKRVAEKVQILNFCVFAVFRVFFFCRLSRLCTIRSKTTQETARGKDGREKARGKGGRKKGTRKRRPRKNWCTAQNFTDWDVRAKKTCRLLRLTHFITHVPFVRIDLAQGPTAGGCGGGGVGGVGGCARWLSVAVGGGCGAL